MATNRIATDQIATQKRDTERRPLLEPPAASRWQLIVSGTLLLLWILFLAWIAMAG